MKKSSPKSGKWTNRSEKTMRKTVNTGWMASKDRRDSDWPVEEVDSPLQGRVWKLGAPPLDQGMLPACVGYAGADWLLCEPIVQILDPVGLYTLCNETDERAPEPHDGST